MGMSKWIRFESPLVFKMLLFLSVLGSSIIQWFNFKGGDSGSAQPSEAAVCMCIYRGVVIQYYDTLGFPSVDLA